MIIHPFIPIAYAVTCTGVIAFQFALIAGAPWGHLTQGGGHEGTLPRGGRFFAGISVVLLAAMAMSILSAADLWPHWPIWTGWAALGLQSLVTLLNWITRSVPERRLWGPVTTAMLALASAVMLGSLY